MNSYGFSMVFMVFPWFSYDFPMVFLWGARRIVEYTTPECWDERPPWGGPHEVSQFSCGSGNVCSDWARGIPVYDS